MHNRASSWEAFLSERINCFQKLLKSSKKFFYLTLYSLWAKLSKKKFFLIRSEILGLLVNTLTVNREYSRSNRDKLPLPTQITLSKKEYTFFDIFFSFLLYTRNFQLSVQNMSLISHAFLKLLTPKDVLS